MKKITAILLMLLFVLTSCVSNGTEPEQSSEPDIPETFDYDITSEFAQTTEITSETTNTETQKENINSIETEKTIETDEPTEPEKPTETLSPPKEDKPENKHCEFEYLLSESTDVVIAQYINSKPFGETLTENEFAVSDRILGNAPDKIFIYSEGSGNLFNTGIDYLLPLSKIRGVTAKTHEDGYVLLFNLIIDLNNPQKSTMHGELLTLRSVGLDFSDQNLSKTQIVSYVQEKTKNNKPSKDYIKSDRIEDIIYDSPNILFIEVNKDGLLTSPRTVWASSDIYWCTVVQTLKGNIEPGFELVMVFFADTVKPGEQYIIAAEPLEEGNNDFLVLTSKNSLFEMERLDEIERIINGG